MSYLITAPISLSYSNGVVFNYAITLNDSGEVVGSGYSGFEAVGTTWQAGTVTALTPLSTDTSANGYGINDSGVVVGQSLSAAGTHHAVSWTNGTVSALTDYGYGSRAIAISQNGLIVGSAQSSTGLDQAVEWQNGAITALGTLPGGSSYLNVAASRALSVNNANQVVGFALTSADVDHGFLWQNGTMADLGTLSGGTTSEALSINASGQIVGFGNDSSFQQQGILWVNGVATQLADLSTGGSGEAQAINDSGVIVGYSTTSTGAKHAVIWQNGSVIDLNSLLPSSSPWVLTVARGINNQGQIVGTATNDGFSEQFTLTLGSSATSATTAQSALSQYTANSASGPFLVSDTAANIQSNLDGLETLAKASKLFSITPTDALTQTLTLTDTQYLADGDALNDISGTVNLSLTGVSAYNAQLRVGDTRVTSVAISDTASDISFDLSSLLPLVTAGQITSITVTGGGSIAFSYKNWAADTALEAKLQGSYTLDIYNDTAAQGLSLSGTADLKTIGITDTAANVLSNFSAIQTLAKTYTVFADITDTAANIASNLDGLETAVQSGQLGLITLTDTGIPTLSITASQLVSDQGVLGDMIGSFGLLIDASQATNLTIQGYHKFFGEVSDTVVFKGNASDYNIAALANGQGVTVTDVSTGRTSVDTLTGINAIQFSDTTVIVAHTPSSGTPTSGNITELYGAVFGRLPDVAGLAYYQAQQVTNPAETLTNFATSFLQSPEYTNKAAHKYAQNTAGETQFITDMYNNLLHRAPESGAVPYYLNLISQLTQGATTGTTAYSTADLNAHATLLVDFSNSGEFLNNVQVTAQHPADANHWLILI